MSKTLQEQLKDHIQEAIEGETFLINADFMASGIMSKMDALFWFDLMGLYDLNAAIIDDDDFMYCPTELFEASLKWSKDEQEGIIARLQAMNYLKVNYKNGDERWILPNVGKFWDDLEKIQNQ